MTRVTTCQGRRRSAAIQAATARPSAASVSAKNGTERHPGHPCRISWMRTASRYRTRYPRRIQVAASDRKAAVPSSDGSEVMRVSSEVMSVPRVGRVCCGVPSSCLTSLASICGGPLARRWWRIPSQPAAGSQAQTGICASPACLGMAYLVPDTELLPIGSPRADSSVVRCFAPGLSFRWAGDCRWCTLSRRAR